MQNPTVLQPKQVDPSTRSNPLDIRVTHFDLHWIVDFKAKVLKGDVIITAKPVNPETGQALKELVLDIKHLEIGNVVSLASGKEIQTKIVKGPREGEIGDALVIPINVQEDTLQSNGTLQFKIDYSTTPESSAVQWLDAAATKDKTAPFLFTQCQAIHARTLLPCQDTPTVKATYTATVRCPKGTTAVMSALGNGDAPMEVHEEDGSKTFSFRQPVAIASYLVALAVGSLGSKRVGPRSFVWAEPSVVDAAAYEFADTEQFVATGEQICGPYVWTRYDVLCMPPSFPYGGMENPCLTFVTPTLLAGDRSLADVVIHEITHSWTGNLVTNQTWEHFWLNEGWTMLIQRKIVKALYGKKVADLDAIEGLSDLQDSISRYGNDHNFTRLVPDLSENGGVDPDDAFSTVPYEKGHALLCTLQNLVGGPEVFDPFIKAYVANFGKPTMTLTSQNFKDFCCTYFKANHGIDLLVKLNWDKWFFSPGMPQDMHRLFDDSLLKRVRELTQLWVKSDSTKTKRLRKEENDSTDKAPSEDDMTDLTCAQTTLWLKDMRENHLSKLSVSTLNSIDALYKLSERQNSEIRFNWQRLCIDVGKTDIVPYVKKFLCEQGRMKFVRPLYRALLKASINHPMHKDNFYDAAVETFKSAASSYHPIASKMIASDIAMHNKQHTGK